MRALSRSSIRHWSLRSAQIAMIPMLAWIANSAPANLKATFFAVMASFTNLALSLSQLGTKYLNEIYIVTREKTRSDVGHIHKHQPTTASWGSPPDRPTAAATCPPSCGDRLCQGVPLQKRIACS